MLAGFVPGLVLLLATVPEQPASRPAKRFDREGVAFRGEVGGFHNWHSVPESGLQLGLQAGYFFGQRAGVLLGWAFSAAAHDGLNGDGFRRHDIAVEAQVFPVEIGPVSPGAFAHVGVANANPSGHGFGPTMGGAFGAGFMIEVAVTARMAIAFRTDHTAGNVGDEDGWFIVSTYTGGVALYGF